MKSAVQVQSLPEGNYRDGMTSLPPSYPRAAYFRRQDVSRIRAAVFECLDALDAVAGIRAAMAGKTVIVKPNLVTVYHDMGFTERDYPETTDPRVLDALVEWLGRSNADIVIAESSGRGAPTRGSFFVAGLDRLARFRRCRLVALEEEPVLRYLLPKAKVQREIAIPRLFAAVVEGRAFYVSAPKLKTNLYTGVTLGFKNAMGCLPYNMRQRNHTNHIERKLVELLYLFKPDLSLIDGVVGGEGNCPAPVDPVDSRLIIAGTQALETDRVATRLMGFDPGKVELTRLADELGFGDPATHISIPEHCRVLRFRPASSSLTSDDFHARFPTVLVLSGSDPGRPCHGGCLPSTRFAFEMLEREGLRIKRGLCLILGSSSDGIWRDREGRGYRLEEILKLPQRKLSIGNCAKAVTGRGIARIGGCMPFPNAQHVLLHKISGTSCRVMGLRNRNLLPLLWASLATSARRMAMIRRGERMDVALSSDNSIVEIEKLSKKDKEKAFIPSPLPPLSVVEKREALSLEAAALLSLFTGVPLLNLRRRLPWLFAMACAATCLLLPLPVAAILGRPWLGAIISGAVALLHICEIPLALGLEKMRAYPRFKAALMVFFFGFTFWVPVKKGIFAANA